MKRIIFSKTRFRIILIIASIAAAALCVLPVMKGYFGGAESCTLIVRGFNLMEFSAWGVIPVFAVLLIPIIVLGQHSRKVKELILLILFTVNTVSYVHAFNEARAWLNEVCDTNVTCHVWGILIPLAFPVVLTLAKIFDIITQKEWREYVYDLPF